MKAIGFDQSLTGFGWAVLSDTGGGNLLRCGVWSTQREAAPGKVTADNTRRFGFLGQCALELVEAERSSDSYENETALFIEGLGVFGDRFTTAIGQGRLLGIVEGIALTLRLPLAEVPSLEVKKLVPIFGKRRKVEKREVADAVFELYPEARELVREAVRDYPRVAGEKAAENVTDSIAIAHVGMRRAAFVARLSAGGGGW